MNTAIPQSSYPDIKVGDLVKEHTIHSKHRTGLVTDIRQNHYLTIKWLNGDIDREALPSLTVLDVTKLSERRGEDK